MKAFFFALINLCVFLNAYSQKHDLQPTENPRFEITDKVWSNTIGDASVCLWNDDKLSAFTITIDDNNEQDIPYWKQMHEKYGFHFTWFVITEAEEKYNVKDWGLFNELVSSGHAVQGHDDRNWFADPKNGGKFPTIKKYLKRLKATQDEININIGNHPCITYAYPWGEGKPDEVSKLFIATRGVIALLNPANNVVYSNIRSISNPHIYGSDSTRNKYILPLITKTSKLEDINYYRGWGSTHFHHINSDEAQSKTDEFLNYLKQKENELWIGTFPDVAKYSQEYSSHSLKLDSISDYRIALTLTDEMQDATFDFPLTIKVRVANNWTEVSATQNGKNIESKVIVYNQSKYALVKAIPDRGQVVLLGKIDEGTQKNSSTSRYELATLKDAFHIPTTASPEAQEMLKLRKRSGRNTAKTPKGDAPHSEWKEFQDFLNGLVLKGLNPIKEYYQPTIDTIQIGGIRAIDIKPKNYKKSDKVVVYIHGGAYVVLAADATLASMLPLAQSSGLRIIAIDYSLAPQAKYEQITDEVIQFYKGLLKEYEAKNIALYGDSAGGGLSAGSILKMRDKGIALPAVLVLWSPWADIDQVGDTYFTLADNDPSLITPNFLQNAALAYAPKSEFKNPYVSPVYGDYSKDFPPTLIQVGSKEIFLSNAIRQYPALDDQHKTVKLDVYEGMWHVWQGHYLLPESKKAVENTKDFILKYLGKK